MRERLCRRRLWVSAGVVVMLGLAGYGYALYDTWTQQLRNSILVDFYARQLKSIHERQGAYPEAFSEKDYWGRDVLYRATDDGFTLISFGRDGVPDSERNARGDASEVEERGGTCGDLNRDTIITSEGTVQVCLK
jgi:hypothetical protein